MVTITGSVSADEILKIMAEYTSQDPPANVIWDFSASTVEQLNSEAMRKISLATSIYGEVRRGGKTAMVFSKNHDENFLHSLKEHARIYDYAFEYRVYTQLIEAIDWIANPERR